MSRIDAALDQRVFSPAAGRVIAIAASPRADLHELTGVIATDPTLAARVVQLANSAAYEGGKKLVATVDEAVRRTGTAAVRDIAVALGLAELVPACGDGFNLVRYWQHSLAVARLTEQLMRHADPERAGVAYLAGLCHDLGALLLHSHLDAEYRQVLDAHAATGLPLD